MYACLSHRTRHQRHLCRALHDLDQNCNSRNWNCIIYRTAIDWILIKLSKAPVEVVDVLAVLAAATMLHDWPGSDVLWTKKNHLFILIVIVRTEKVFTAEKLIKNSHQVVCALLTSAHSCAKDESSLFKVKHGTLWRVLYALWASKHCCWKLLLEEREPILKQQFSTWWHTIPLTSSL